MAKSYSILGRTIGGRGFRVSLLLCSVMSYMPSLCQAPATKLEDMTLEELTRVEVYSASKHLQTVSQAPASVTVITGQQIHEHGFQTLASILETVRGFFVTSDRNYSSVGVRGFARPGDFNTRVLVLIDGHRMNDNVYDQALIGTDFTVDVDLIERIEIVRGPVSALYGDNAVFAVVNIFTKSGGDIKGLQLETSGASENTKQGRITYGRKFSHLEFLSSASFYGSRGQNSLYFDEYNSPSTNFGIASHVDDDQSANAMISATAGNFAFKAVYGTREKGVQTGSYGAVFNNPGNRTVDTQAFLDLRYQRTVNNSLDLLLRGYYDRKAYHGQYEYPSSAVAGELSPEEDYSDGRWAGIELQATKILARNRVTASIEYRDNIRQNQKTYDLNPYTLLLDDKRNSYILDASVQDELKLGPKLLLNAAVRYDYLSSVSGNMDPRIALIYHPANNTSLKLIYGEAFRAPNVFEKYYAVAPNLPNTALSPERLRSGEAVWEQQMPAHMSISTSVFSSSISGLITLNGIDNQALIYQNLNTANSTGVEVEIGGNAPRGPNWVASYSFQETRDGVTDQLLNDSPRSLAKLNLSQQLLHKTWTTSMDAQYRSQSTNIDGVSIRPFALFNFTVVGHAIGKHLDVSASLYNAFNQWHADPAPGANLQDEIAGNGRGLRLQMTWHSTPAK